MLYVKKIWTHQYSLKEIHSKKIHTGLLVKVLFCDDLLGYTVLHPHPNLGEPSLSFCLQILRNQSTHLFTDLCIEGARIDAIGRSKNQNLFLGQPAITSHQLISNIQQIHQIKTESIVKIKMNLQLYQDSLQLRSILQKHPYKIKIRLDFNYQICKKQWQEWSNEFSDLIDWVDFIEDPFVGFEKIKTHWPFAWDWSHVHYCPIRVIKASRYSLLSILKGVARSQFQRVIFTHALTHPLEARLSYAKALQFYYIYPRKKEVCGLGYPKNFFEKNEFLSAQDDFYSGTGLGFDELLKKQKWSLLE